MKATPDKSSAVAARTAATRQADVARADVSRADVPYADVSDSLSDTGTTTPAVSPTGPGLDVRSVRRLQAGAGNAAVARLVAQRYAEVVKPPPSQAPGFRRVRSDVAAKQTKLKRHRPAAVESRSAQDAALAPPDDRQAQGKAANAEKMNEAKPGEFDKGAFIGAVNEAIAAQAPKNLEEADGFADSGRADSIKDSVDGKVKDGKESSAEEIETATTAAPDTSRAKEKQVTPMSPDQPPGNPGAPSAADAVPARQPDEVLDFSEGPQQVDQQMADAEVTEEQLARGNEPQFDRALAEKKKGEQQTAAVPAKGRAAEAEQLAAAKAGAAASGAQAMNAMTADRGAAGRAVDSGKGETKSADEKKREQVTARLQKVFDATQKDVEKILGDLDGKVDRQFTEGEKKARDDFTADHKRRMKEYKDRRYSGWRGPFRWGRDKLKGLPQEGLDIFKKSRELYVTKMQAVISTIADTIGTELGRAKIRIATGRDELKAEVDRLPADLRQFGEEAAADFAGKFDDLESQVNDKSQELVQTLAQKYTEALNSVDEEIKKLEEENKGLIAMVVDAVVGVIQTIMELKNLLMGILAKAASAITKIIKDPIGFLRNLVSSVGAGLNLFIGNIADHLKTGLVSWLLGTAVSTGLAIPSRFDLKGIIQLIASLLGLTWDNIRARITRKGVPEQAMAKVEQSVPVAGALAREGPAGAAQEITAETGDLKTTILDDLKSYLIPTVLIAGITWILSLLNPASAFIRAVKAIIDIVTFIVTQGAQIAAFVNAVLDAVIAIANGAQAGVPKAIETALATSIPLLIGLLASLLGIGGLANKVRQAFQKVSRPVNRAIDKLVDKIARAGKKLWRNFKRGGNESREYSKKDTARDYGNKEARLNRGIGSAVEAFNRYSETPVPEKSLREILVPIRARYRLAEIKPVRNGDRWGVYARVNPSGGAPSNALTVEQRIKKWLPEYGVERAKEVKESWWKGQISKPEIWQESDLVGVEQAAMRYLNSKWAQESVAGFFTGGRSSESAFKSYALMELEPTPSHPVRNNFFVLMGRRTNRELQKKARSSGVLSGSAEENLERMRYTADRQFGRFSPLPIDEPQVDPELKNAIDTAEGEHAPIINFLLGLVKNPSVGVGGISWPRFVELWGPDKRGNDQPKNPNRAFVKTRVREVNPGKHEWIPMNRIKQVVQAAIALSERDLGAALKWVHLQNYLRSATNRVLWEVRNDDGTRVVGVGGHVGAFYRAHVDELSGKVEHKQALVKGTESFHNALRELFAQNSGGTPLEFLEILREKLPSIVWNGKMEGWDPDLLDSNVGALYKVEEDVFESMTVEALGRLQEENYELILQDIASAKARLEA
ncbi:hypothetical protein [Streptomyces sp. NPDC050804]|uniref:phage tail protein n=1 Tax=Streptomyces sp. NPDC050804 TaxID=3154745 RepID=UPI00343E06FB